MKRLRLFGYGAAEYAALGDGARARTIPFQHPELIEFFKSSRVIDVSAGWGHSSFTLWDGNKYEVYVAGRTHDLIGTLNFSRYNTISPKISDLWLKLGFGNSIDAPSPIKIAEFEGLQPSVCCGAGRTIIIHQGKVLSYGFNRYGQCGIISEKNYVWELESPILEETEEIVSACFGFQHSHILSNYGDVYSFGKGKYGQLGLKSIIDSTLSTVGNAGEYFFVPEKIPREEFQGESIQRIVAGTQSSVCLTESGKVYTFGRYQGTEIKDTGDMYLDQMIPREITFFSQNNLVVTEVYASSHAYLAKTRCGKTYLWGQLPSNIDLDIFQLRVQASNPDYQALRKITDISDSKGLNLILHEPFRVNLFLEEGDKIIPAFDGFYVLRKDKRKLSLFDWNLHLEHVHISLEETLKIHNIVCGWRHGFILAE